MYKNQLQELAQRSCFNLPSYSCIREGPDHAPRFKATVNFNGEVFESPQFCTTLRQAEHSAAEVALNSLSNRGPSHSLAARILDETGVYKNLLQEVSQRVGAALPQYTTVRSGLGHLPVFTCTVELAGITFTGEHAKNKKQAEKNAAMAAWSSLKQLAKQDSSSSSETETSDEQEQVTIARALLNYRLKEKMAMANYPNALSPFPKRFPVQHQRPSSAQPPPLTTSKILPLIRPKSVPRNRPVVTVNHDAQPSRYVPPENRGIRPQKFPAVNATPYVPIRHFRAPYHGVAPPVTMRTAVPVFSAPPFQPPANQPSHVMASSARHVTPSVHIRQAVPVFSAPPIKVEKPQLVTIPPEAESRVQMDATGNVPLVAAPQIRVEEPPALSVPQLPKSAFPIKESSNDLQEPVTRAQVVSSQPESSVGTCPQPEKLFHHMQDAGKGSINNLKESEAVQDIGNQTIIDLKHPPAAVEDEGNDATNDLKDLAAIQGVKQLKI